MTIIGLALWFIVGSFLGLIIGGTIGYFTNTKTGALTGLGVAFLFPTSILALMTYSNRVQTPQEHWTAEFKEIPPQGIVFVMADASFSSDFYGRIFQFYTDQKTINAFAKRHGFKFSETEKSVVRYSFSGFSSASPDKVIDKGFPSKSCPNLQKYEAQDYFEQGDNDNTPSDVWIRYCPTTQEAMISIISLD